MAPRKPDEQLDEIRQMLETFTTGLQAALQTSVENAMTTILQAQHDRRAAPQDQQQHREQPHNIQQDDSEDDELAENLFAARNFNQRNPRQDNRRDARHDELDQRQNTPRWESSFKSEIPEFLGTLNPEDFIDWLHMVEEILEFRQVPPDKRVSLVVTRFKGRAMAWWQQLKESRRLAGKPRIDSWERLVKHMRRNFLPFNYERTLYNKLQNLRQSNRSFEDYASDFFHFASRVPTPELESQLIARFIGGLRLQLQNALQQFNPLSVSEAYQRALAMEVQLRPSWSSSSSRPRGQQVTSSDTPAGTDGQITNTTENKATDSIAASRPARTNALRCYSNCLHKTTTPRAGHSRHR